MNRFLQKLIYLKMYKKTTSKYTNIKKITDRIIIYT